MVQGFSLAGYVQLVVYTKRLFRPGKASTTAELCGILESLRPPDGQRFQPRRVEASDNPSRSR
jgi:hypothetical protein